MNRFAISHDGNFHDTDDIGAIAMAEALIWRANVQNQLVHLDYNNHRGANNSQQQTAMEISATGALDLYGITPNKVLNDITHLRRSVLNLAAQINASSATDRLTMIQAGPWEVMAIAFDQADPSKHQYVDIISHSDWNDLHEHLKGHRNKEIFFAAYAAGGKYEEYMPPSYTKILDQNKRAFNSNIAAWDWLSSSPQTNFVLQRTKASGNSQGDMSDAGMVFYLFTGIEDPTMQQVRNFFGL